jgi:hypothetical protein
MYICNMEDKDVKIVIKNDNIHTHQEVMMLLSKLGIDYINAKTMVSEIEKMGFCEVLEASYDKTFSIYIDDLVMSCLDYEIIIIDYLI